MIKDSKQFVEESNSAVFLGTLADIGKYATLLYGIAQVVGNEPQIDKAIYAGLGYALCSFSGRLTEERIADAIVSRLETKLKS